MFAFKVTEAAAREWADDWLQDIDLLTAFGEPGRVLYVVRVNGRGELRRVWQKVKREGLGVCFFAGCQETARIASEWRLDARNGGRCYASPETVRRYCGGRCIPVDGE